MPGTAAELFDRMRLAYASCQSYRDTGEVVTVFITGPLPSFLLGARPNERILVRVVASRDSQGNHPGQIPIS